MSRLPVIIFAGMILAIPRFAEFASASVTKRLPAGITPFAVFRTCFFPAVVACNLIRTPAADIAFVF